MLWFKIKAGALQLTLFIIVVIALLLTAIILLVNTHKRFQIQTDFIIETTRNTNKGVNYALRNNIPLRDTTTVELNDEDYKSLKIQRDFWGVFERVTVVSRIKNNRFQKTALIGAKLAENNRTALYIQDNNKPLVLVGNTKIEGLAYLPKQGVKPGTISGQSYFGSQLIYGMTKNSSNLPKIFTETDKQIRTIENQISKVSQEYFFTVENSKTYSNSFFKPTQVLFSNGKILLDGIKLTGNIIIQSKTKIHIYASSVLKDVILIAPEIEIKDNVIGSFQAIASKQIIVGKNVQLQYPSALLVNEKQELLVQDDPNQTIDNNFIAINDNSNIKGLIVYLGKEKTNNYKPQIKIKENATLIGELYCNQNTELIGTVFGSVYTNNFIANQFGSIYQNHIYNGTININELPEEYIGLPFNNSKKGVLKWLY